MKESGLRFAESSQWGEGRALGEQKEGQSQVSGDQVQFTGLLTLPTFERVCGFPQWKVQMQTL